MGGISAPRYRLPCCGKASYQPPTAALCVECAMATTPLEDPAAVAYRERCAARAALRAPTEAP